MLEFENACPDTPVPPESAFALWTAKAISATSAGKPVSVGIRIVDEHESAQLNRDYRGKDYATNVLSFGHELPAMILDALDELPLGDLTICAPVVLREAAEQGKSADAHWAHMVIHGLLHLQGHDHEDDAQAEAMEALERRLLKELGIADPYQEKTQENE
jgi:probable rRNA maturation factor